MDNDINNYEAPEITPDIFNEIFWPEIQEQNEKDKRKRKEDLDDWLPLPGTALD